MNENWFDEGFKAVVEEAATFSGLDKVHVKAVYASLQEQGLIDYDTEKEVFYRIIHPEDCD